MSDNIKVVVKVRPLISREIEEKQPCQWRLSNNTLYQLDSNGRDFGQTYTFDQVYSESTKTSDVFNDIAKPIVEAATGGFNGTIFAYGQTSSGKTYTMTGTEGSPGIIPLAVLNLFKLIKLIPDRDFLVRASYIEIYNETLKDLLDLKKENIKIHETYDGNIKVDVTEKVTSSPEEVLAVMKEGEANRQTGSTNMNEKSSRSHTIFQITIESREHIEGEEQTGSVNVSQLNLVDLAGSERAGQTGATGLRFKEGTHINKSLSALALVIKQLSEDPNKYANYRDSKLTRLLQNSLGGNAKTSIICAVTPAALEETISTLQFATRAKAIKNKPAVNVVGEADKTMIQSLTKQLSKLQTELQNKKNLEVMLEKKEQFEQDLQKRIANLQKLILNGFHQRQSLDIGARRMQQAPRRQTISTLHSIVGEPTPDVPKFRTPMLKYNPMNIQNPSDFVPIQSSKLPTLPEESPRLITPPPNIRRVHFKSNQEGIIELDSDDDEDSSHLNCSSPHHGCYNNSKTPPCKLRENAKEAEKKYDEILQLTKLEKIYVPSVVELMERIEKSSDITMQLRDEIDALQKSSKEKDLVVEHLTCKIKNTEEEFMKTKLELDKCTEEYKSKLTDWEVYYETLQKKAKLREEELLSLLEEQKLKKCEEIGKLSQKNLETIPLIDISYRDISLVNSDNETSIIHTNDSEKNTDLVSSLQDQLIEKSQIILQLEANIASQKTSIEYLEQCGNDLQKSFDECNTKASCLEADNKLLQSNIETLNDTVKCQKDRLEIVQHDIDSYKSIIQELQLKLLNKDNLLSMNIDDSDIETMIANEEKALANNDNMKNIIHCFKISLDNRNKEINELNSTIKNMSQNKSSMEELIDKTKQIDTLNEEISSLKVQINDNITTINNLIIEKKNLSALEKELTEKLSELEIQRNELYELSKENTEQIQELKQNNEKSLCLLNAKEREHLSISSQLQSQIDILSNKVIDMEADINEKNNLIQVLNKHNNDKQDYEHKAKSAVDKLKNVITILNGEVKEIPELLDDLITLFNTLFVGLSTLEQLANNTIAEKKLIDKENSQLKIKIEELQNSNEKNSTTLKDEVDSFKRSLEVRLNENEKLNDTNAKLTEDISKIQKELEVQCNDYKTLQELYETVNVSKNELKEKLQNIQQHGEILEQKSFDADKLKCELNDKYVEIANLNSQLNDQAQMKDEFVDSIIEKLCSIISKLKIQTTRDEEYNLDNILTIFDKIVNYIEHNNLVNEQNIATMKQLLNESKEKTETVTGENNTLKNMLSVINVDYEKLSIELENKSIDSKSLNENLTFSNALLEQLREDLRTKSLEIKGMEMKAKEWKEQFIHLDNIMKEQMQHLQHENEKLKNRIQELNCGTTQGDSMSHDGEDSGFKDDKCLKNMSEIKGFAETMSPPSLLTICCNTIVEAIEPKQSDYSVCSAEEECTKCDQLSLELSISKQENCTLTSIIEQLERANKDLLQEQNNVRREVQLLLEPAQDLHKKITGHKTNLSILTATTYAENKLLKSQVKSLQHHHSRFHHVCARDIPEVKRQLTDLLIVLKGESTVSEIQNVSLKRYSLPVLDNFKNESTLDGDLLMLDTNITLGDTTHGDNTLVGCDPTCLDTTQAFNEVSYQNNELDQTNLRGHMSVLEIDNQNMFQKVEILKEENCRLKQLVDKLSMMSKVDAITSPIKIPKAEGTSPIKISNPDAEILCKTCTDDHLCKPDCKEIERLTEIVTQMQTEKENIETKYNDLLLEVPSTDKLVIKIKDLERTCDFKTVELTKLNGVLSNKLKKIKSLQEENDSLSTQVMENISESDDLNKEINILKTQNIELIEKIQKYESNNFSSTECQLIDEVVISDVKASPHAKLSRSFSDSDTSTSYNKICTLQNELQAGREDCQVIREDVATIKQHLDCSNMSVDSIECMEDAKEFITPDQEPTSCMPDIQEERPLDLYTVDKMDCFNYYREIIGEEEDRHNDMKIIDIMKMLYNNLVAKHGNEVENLLNKLKDYEESRNKLQKQIDDMESEFSTIAETVEKKEKDISIVSKMIRHLNIDLKKINLHASNAKNHEDLKEMVNMFKQKVLGKFDYEFGIYSTNVFDVIVEKYEEELLNIEKQCTALESQNNNLSSEIETTNCNLIELRNNLDEKEKEYNLLNAQKLRMHEISSAVTLDIVKREQEINNILKKSIDSLTEMNIISSDLNLTDSVVKNIDTIVASIIDQNKIMINKQRQYENELLSLKSQIQILKDTNNNVTIELTDKGLKVRELELQCNDLQKTYDSIVEENVKNLSLINQLQAELEGKTANIQIVKDLEEDNERLKSLNQMILKEKESCSIDLEKASATIKQNNVELEKMSSDILIMRASVKDSASVIESMKQEVQKLSVENSELKQNFEEKSQECSRLEINIRTHDKAAEIQSRIIKRLKNVKEEDDKSIIEKQTKIDEITQKCTELQSERIQLQEILTATREEMEKLKVAKDVLEVRVSELEEVAANKPRLSLDTSGSRRQSLHSRRQSLHDSKRILTDLDEHKNLEAVFESLQKHDDLFMDVDGDDNSGRSTPLQLARGRDSLLSRTDQSDRESDPPSRPSSVAAITRRRRQSIHDSHRAVDTHNISPHDISKALISSSRDTSATNNKSSEVTQLKEQLAAVTHELEDLKERYKELDEECEICGQYLQEKDERLRQFRVEKIALEAQVKELKSRSESGDKHSVSKPNVAHVAVNTDEDWTNLHAVVVDRMSFDAEVDKNKKLRKTVEELRFKNQDLKNTIEKMQKALNRNSTKDTKELQATKEELEAVKTELSELKVNYKALDEECETCAQYLREREEQCRKLRDAKDALERKLEELQDTSHSALAHSVRKKRQTIYDKNRNSTVEQIDAATETTDELLIYHVERDNAAKKASDDTHQKEIKRLKMIIEKVSHQKSAVEEQLRSQQHNPVYVATGSAIVQNQQLSDVMRENQRLKVKNQKLTILCKKLTKNNPANRENEDPCGKS